MRFLAKYGCKENYFEEEICTNTLFVICGFDKEQFNYVSIPRMPWSKCNSDQYLSRFAWCFRSDITLFFRLCYLWFWVMIRLAPRLKRWYTLAKRLNQANFANMITDTRKICWSTTQRNRRITIWRTSPYRLRYSTLITIGWLTPW